MESILITSRRNRLVKRLKSLATKKGREENDQLLLEGTHLLVESIKTSISPLEVILTQEWINSNSKLYEEIKIDCAISLVTQDVLEAALTTKTPDGVASIIPLNSLPEKPDKTNFILALDRLQDPGNMGNLFRTALAAEVDLVLLALGADPLSQKVIRASTGAILQLPFERFSFEEMEAIEKFATKLDAASKKGYQVLSTTTPYDPIDEKAVPYWEIDWSIPTLLALGNEGAGLHPVIKSCCDQSITLPHSNKVESLNVASAAVPILLERKRVTMTKDTKKKS